MAKKVNLLVPRKRVELWWAYSAAYTLFVLAAYWIVDDLSEQPLARIMLCPVIVIGYVVIALLVNRYYDKGGKRVVIEDERRAEQAGAE